jgi:hypothetical protein
MAESLAGKSESRWWEYYVLRYFVGTVVGAIAIVFLVKLPDSPLRGFPLIGELSSLQVKDMPALIVIALGAFGFTYCYIASTPMLLLHATRAQLGLSPLRLRWRFWLPTSVAIICLHRVMVWGLSIRWWSSRSFGALVFLIVVGVQLAIVVDAHRDRFNRVTSFYEHLAQARGRESQSVVEYVESYRHLREHGNACAILALEFTLALVLFSARELCLALVAVILWLFPSTYAWFIGSLLEAGSNWRDWPDDGQRGRN